MHNKVDLEVKETCCYRNFKELCSRTEKLKLKSWQFQLQEGSISLIFYLKEYAIPKYEINIDENLRFTCSVFGWLLPNEHEIYANVDRNMKNITVSDLLCKVETMQICGGVKMKDEQLVDHSVPLKVVWGKENKAPFNVVVFKQVMFFVYKKNSARTAHLLKRKLQTKH